LSRKILVVDHTVDTRELLHLYLKTAGYTIFVAADGGEGFVRARLPHARVDPQSYFLSPLLRLHSTGNILPPVMCERAREGDP
jgi:CheY-like chemotaxis protein